MKSLQVAPMCRWTLMAVSTVILSSCSVVTAQPCGPANTTITIAGATSVKPLADVWAAAYMERCPGVTVSVDGGGSTDGAERVCAASTTYTPVDIGTMSREWNLPEEALVDESGWRFQCQAPGDETRSVLQLQVALDAVSVPLMVNGSAAKCVASMGGLTTDQLRWMYSSYNESQLEATGWNAMMAVPNSDGIDSTHLWSELSLSPDCLPNEIKIAGPGADSGTHDFFREVILLDSDGGGTENFPDGIVRPYYDFMSSLPDIVNFTENDEDAIAYVGYADYAIERAYLYAAPIRNSMMNESSYVLPGGDDTVSNATYTPLSRPLYMNLYNDEVSLTNTVPFVQFALSPNGTRVIQLENGFLPLNQEQRLEMLNRIGGTGLPPTQPPTPSPTPSDNANSSISTAPVGTAAPIMSPIPNEPPVGTAPSSSGFAIIASHVNLFHYAVSLIVLGAFVG